MPSRCRRWRFGVKAHAVGFDSTRKDEVAVGVKAFNVLRHVERFAVLTYLNSVAHLRRPSGNKSIKRVEAEVQVRRNIVAITLSFPDALVRGCKRDWA